MVKIHLLVVFSAQKGYTNGLLMRLVVLTPSVVSRPGLAWSCWSSAGEFHAAPERMCQCLWQQGTFSALSSPLETASPGILKVVSEMGPGTQ